ncbi:OsmC family protein [Sphingobacterium endophyticum]|uniref:OsmC family protein n=1 Tax=Sphingobacterium endophyticum TaxID=2546448 RepID=UPI0012E1C6B8|nr:OsmC family protein [Sphingobacterium endophyticum]
MKRTANAIWNGNIKSGSGKISTQSGVLNSTQYSFNTRFADGIGTNPEELLGAAHAGCFTMAMSLALTQLGYEPGNLNTTANVYFDMEKGKIEMVELNLTADTIAGLSSKEFEEIARGAKENCLISKALTGLDITLSVEYKEG